MFEEIQEKSRSLTLINEITRSSLQAKDLNTLLQVVVDLLGELLHADGCFITLWDETHQTVNPAAAYGELRQTYPSNPAIPGELTMTESVLRAGQPLAADDVFQSSHISPLIAQK
jgi:GAF domain-containing protein